MDKKAEKMTPENFFEIAKGLREIVDKYCLDNGIGFEDKCGLEVFLLSTNLAMSGGKEEDLEVMISRLRLIFSGLKRAQIELLERRSNCVQIKFLG